MRRAGLFLVLLGAGALGDDPVWHTTLAEAKAAGKKARKPVLCILLEPGHGASQRLDAALQRKTLADLLARFACVKLPPKQHLALAKKYDIRHWPAIVVFTSIGTPMKLLVGPMPISKTRRQLDAALQKHHELWNPKRPKRRPASNLPDKKPRARPPTRFHAATCPTACVTCTPATKRGLQWLLRRQQDDGRWKKKRSGPTTIDRSIDHVDVALTALAGLALLASGKHPEATARADAFLQEHTRADGLVALSARNDPLYLTYGHFETPLAAMFLAELQSQRPTAARGRVLARIAKYLAGVQDKNGAWGYSFDFAEHPAYARRGWRLLATSHACLTALCFLRDAGIAVDKSSIERGAAFVKSCRGRDGGFVYRREQRYTPGVPGTTAGALAALQYTGLYSREFFKPYWARYRRDWDRIDAFGRHRFWFVFWTALAMHRRGPGAFDAFDLRFRDALLHEQERAGSWFDKGESGGRVFSTAVATLALHRFGTLKLATARRASARPQPIENPQYLKPAFASSRVKVFKGAAPGPPYRFDLVVSTEKKRTRAEFERIARGLRAANRVLFDLTDGQFALHRAVVVDKKRLWDTADIRVTKEFFDADKNPHPGAMGITRLRRRTEISGGREVRGKRIGEWILFPPGRVSWTARRTAVVVAHELAHYLFGVRDEYGHCDCVMALNGRTELCTKAGHTDERRDAACWTLAKRLYPRLRAPTDQPDPGPWEPPEPLIEIRE